jgi:hypothetical protein
MTQPSSVIYLPPGVVPAATAAHPSTGVPFDRQFFEAVLPKAVRAFCNTVECKVPRVEVYTGDGSTHFVNAISGVTDAWVALQTSHEQHTHAIEVFLPYQTIFRVEIHPEDDEGRGHLGFLLPAMNATPPAVQPAITVALASGQAKAEKAAPAKPKK